MKSNTKLPREMSAEAKREWQRRSAWTRARQAVLPMPPSGLSTEQRLDDLEEAVYRLQEAVDALTRGGGLP